MDNFPLGITETILLFVIAQRDPFRRGQVSRYAELLQLQSVCRQFRLAIDGLIRRRALRPYFGQTLIGGILNQFARRTTLRVRGVLFRKESPLWEDTTIVQHIFGRASDLVGRNLKDLIKSCEVENTIQLYKQPPSVIRFLMRNGDYFKNQDKLNALVLALTYPQDTINTSVRVDVIRDVVYPEALLEGANSHQRSIEDFLCRCDGTILYEWDAKRALGQLWRIFQDADDNDGLYDIFGLIEAMIAKALKFACEHTSMEQHGAGGIVKLMIEENLILPTNAIALLCGTGLPFYRDDSLAELVEGLNKPIDKRHQFKVIENLVSNGYIETAIVVAKKINTTVVHNKLWKEVLGHVNRDELAKRLKAAAIPYPGIKLHEKRPGYIAALVTMAGIIGVDKLDVSCQTRDLVRTHLAISGQAPDKSLFPTVKRILDIPPNEPKRRRNIY